MRRRLVRPACLVPLLVAACAAPALAQYKCTAADGRITFQQVPCPPGQKAQPLDVRPNGGPRTPPASAVWAPQPASGPPHEASADKRMLANNARAERIEALRRDLQALEKEVAGRGAEHTAEIAAVRAVYQHGGANGQPANPADLSNAIRAVDDKYRAMDQLDQNRLKTARDALAKAEATPQVQP